MKTGIPFHGDETYYARYTFDWFVSQSLNVWASGLGAVVNYLTIPQAAFLVALTDLLCQELAVKLYLLLSAFLPYTLMYWSAKIMASEWKLFGPRQILLFSMLSSGFFGFNFANRGLTGGGNLFVWPYMMLPVTFALFVRFLNRGMLKDAFFMGLASVLANAQPIWLWFFLLLVITYLILGLVKKSADVKLLLKRVVLASVIVLGLNAYWFIPTYAGYSLGASGFFSQYTPEKLITYGSLSYLSFYTITDALMFGHRSYFLFYNFPKNWDLMNIFIPLFAFGALFIYNGEKKRILLFLSIITLVAIFLSKGVNPPLGELYFGLASSLPYGVGAILKDPTKFYAVLAFAYAFLASYFIIRVYDKLRLLRVDKKVRLTNFKFLLPMFMAVLFLAPAIHGSLVDLKAYTYPQYRPTYVPEVYNKVITWLSEQPGDFKVMWLPSGGAYPWKDNDIITAFPDLMSPKPSVPYTHVWPYPLNETNNIGHMLSILGVKYLIFHSDSNFPNDEAYTLLSSQKDLKEISKYGTIPLGFKREVLLKVRYRLSQEILDAGYGGRFWDGFNIRMAVLPLGREVVLEQVWEDKMAESLAFNQQCFNDLEGTVYFNITIPLIFKGSGVSLYLNYYDGGFKSISPIYYLGSLTFDNTTIHYEQSPNISHYFNATMVTQKIEPKTAGIYIFENTNVVAPIYTSLQLPSNFELQPGNSVTLVRYERVSPVEWCVSIDASTPFVLVFTEPYDPLWRAYVNGKEIEPIKSYLVNAFPIEDGGSLYIKIYYKLQSYFNLGCVLSLITAIIVVAWAIFDKLKFGIRIK